MAEISQTLSDDYDPLIQVLGSIGKPGVIIGERGQCRFCGETAPKAFKSVAHALPEAFGNKWVISLDECDACNSRFGSFDDALVKCMGAVLTVGGTRGKDNKVRQTGRTGGPATIRHQLVDGKRSISMRVNGTPLEEHVGINLGTGEFAFRVPAGTERYIPVRAYKALTKMAVALLPPTELPQFSKIIEWLGSPDHELLPHMIAGLSFASVGNAPPLLSAALLKRKSDRSDVPYMLFVTSMGSVCLQIVLKSDERDGPWPSALRTRPNIKWTNVIGTPENKSLSIAYGWPTHLDWGRFDLQLPAIEAIITTVHPRRGQARMEPVIRTSAIAPAAP